MVVRYYFMSRAKKTLFVGSVLFGLEFLTLAVVFGRISAWSHQRLSALPKTAAPSVDAPPVGVNAPAHSDGSVVLATFGESTPDLGRLFAITERAPLFFQSRPAVPACFKLVLAPKVSRHIFKSVLNI